MKKIILLVALTILSTSGRSQISTLSQNFDGVCASGTGIPSSWLEYTPAHLGTIPQGEWVCTSNHGKGGTPGMQCTDTFSNATHLDSSFLLTPLLGLSSYVPGHVYLQFDTKTSNFLLGGELTILHTTDSTDPDTATAINLTPGMMPVFTNGDSTDWVTHVIDLTPYESTGSFYIAFMFTSTATTGSIWFLDNVLLTTHNITLHDPELNAAELKMSIIGRCSSNQINVGITNGKGDYQMVLTDMTGRVIYMEQVNVPNSNLRYSIKGLNLAPGMYFLKMGNGQSFDVTKVVVQ